MNKHEKIKDFFTQWAISGRHEKMAEGHVKSVSKMLNYLDFPDSCRFLDVGCGNDWYRLL